ncbi:MAG TPA: histidine kinase dimerization/phospho-acceptor domain-containing protein [Rudaea sp.]|nr:histidine kinase dimerization/phospho-acceptor domain-containing protein [Rudaea sp.]
MNWLSKLGLRARVAFTFALLGLVVSACVALVAEHFSDSYVHRLIDEMLRVEGDYLRERFADDGVTPRPHTRHFYVFNDGATGHNVPPPELASLDPGVYEINDGRGERHIAVYDVAGRKLYVVLDIGLEGARERRLARDLIALVLFGTGLSAWLGWLWAGRAIEPVRRLAQQVEVLEPSQRDLARLAPAFAADEVGALAQAFDRYQEKLYEYVRRERAFTADASHELRTPLAVIRGAIEVMLDSGSCSTAEAARLRRMQRGSDELRDLLDALLLLARSDEREGDGPTSDVDAVVTRLLGERADALREKHLEVRHSGISRVAVPAPQRVLNVVVGNLLRAVTQFAEGGVLRVEVSPDTLIVAHASTAVAVETLTQRPGADSAERVLGLGMIRRVCERWGWALDENFGDGGERGFVLRFGAHA